MENALCIIEEDVVFTIYLIVRQYKHGKSFQGHFILLVDWDDIVSVEKYSFCCNYALELILETVYTNYQLQIIVSTILKVFLYS